MQRLIAFALLVFTIRGLQQKAPSKLLTEEQMVSILVDLELAKAMAAYYTDDEASASQLLKENARRLYEVYDIAPDTFQKSYQYYLTHLEIMKGLYDAVIKRLEELGEKI